MNDHEALLATIKAFPDDDAPRLIYADWLDEHDDDARAEFIRVQCQLAKIKRQQDWDVIAYQRAMGFVTNRYHVIDQTGLTYTHRYACAKRNSSASIVRYGQAGCTPWSNHSRTLVVFSFTAALLIVQRSVVPLFLKRGTDLRLAAPMLEHLTIYGPRGYGEALASSPALKSLRTLDLAG